MVGRQSFAPDRESFPIERLRLIQMSLKFQHQSVVVKGHGDTRMPRWKGFAVNLKRFAIKRLGFCELAPILQHPCQVA